MRIFYLILGVIGLLMSVSVNGQKVRGKVIDSLSRQPIAFANITLSDGRTGTSTDIEGIFSLTLPPDYSGNIYFSHISYQKKIVALSYLANHPTTSLLPAATSLTEIVVTATKENPAHRIIRQAVAHKKDHDPDQLKSYQYISYNKYLLTMSAPRLGYDSMLQRIKNSDSVKQTKERKSFTSFDSLLKETHFFLSESVTEKQKINPDKEKETLLALKVSGFKSPLFTNVATDYQPLSFYKDNISLLGKDYANPVSKGTFSRYDFTLSDTAYQGNDTTYIIKYKPKPNSFFNGLRGILWITTDGFAIKSVVASSADTLALTGMRIRQNYEKIDGRWFPVQLNTDLDFFQYGAYGRHVQAQHRSFLKEIKINPELKRSAFGDVKVELTLPSTEQNKVTLDKFRNFQLDHRETRTYTLVDSVLRKVRWFDGAFESIVTQAIPLGLFEFDLGKLAKINDYENFRLGGGLYTSNRFSKWVRLGGYAGYGFRDEQWKYGGDMRFNFNLNKDLFLKLSYAKDIYETGSSHLTREGQLPGAESFRMWVAYSFDRTEFYKAELGSRLLPDIHGAVFISKNEIIPTYNYQLQLNSSELLSKFLISEAGVTLRYVKDESYMSLRGKKVFLGQRYPVITLSFAKATSLFEAQSFNYTRVDFTAKFLRKHRYGGKTRFFFAAGWVDGIAPYGKLYNGRGTSATSYLVDDYFQSMSLYEFTASKYASVFLQHNFGNVLLNKKFSKPELVFYHNMGIGLLENQSAHVGLPLQSFDKGYAESGIGLNNLIRGKYARLAYWGVGGGLFYRYGPYQLAKQTDNLTCRVNFSFSL